MKIASFYTAAGTIGRTGYSVVTFCGAISIAELPSFNNAVATYRRTIVVVKRIAARCTATVIIVACRYLFVCTSRVTPCFTPGVDINGASIVILAVCWTITVARFARINNAITAEPFAIVINLLRTTGRTATVIRIAKRDLLIGTLGTAVVSTANQSV